MEIGEESSIWFNTVLRGDVNTIRLGSRTNIQDLTMIHVEKGTFPTRIGDDVTVGHHVVIHGCTIGNRVLVGIGAMVSGRGGHRGRRASSPPGRCSSPGRMSRPARWSWVPRKVKRPLTEAERAGLLASAAGYVLNAKLHRG